MYRMRELIDRFMTLDAPDHALVELFLDTLQIVDNTGLREALTKPLKQERDAAMRVTLPFVDALLSDDMLVFCRARQELLDLFYTVGMGWEDA